MAADEWVPSQWLVHGLLASAISGASFIFVAFACEYVKRYHRERQERQHQVILQKLLRGEIPVEMNNTMALVPARTSVGATPGSARGSFMVDSYKQRGGFLGVGRGYYTTQARAWQMLDSGLGDNRTPSGHVTVWSAESSVDKPSTSERGDDPSARIFPLTRGQTSVGPALLRNHLQPAAAQAQTSYISRLSQPGQRPGSNNSVCRKTCEEMCARMVKEHPFIAPFLRRDLVEELQLDVPAAPENPSSCISEGAGDRNLQEPAGDCEPEPEPETASLSMNGSSKKSQLASRPADTNADPSVLQSSRVDQSKKVRSMSRAPTLFDLRFRPGVSPNIPRVFDKRAQSVSRTSAPGTTPSPRSGKPNRGRSVSRYLKPKDETMRVDSQRRCLLEIEKSPSMTEKVARFIPGSKPVQQTPVRRNCSMDKPMQPSNRFMGNRRSSSVISKHGEQETVKKDQMGESTVQSPKDTHSRENIASKHIAQHGSSVDPSLLDCRHEVKEVTGAKRAKGKVFRKCREIGSTIKKPDNVFFHPDQTTQEEREDEITLALAKWGFPIRSRQENKQTPDMEVTQPEPTATDLGENMEVQPPCASHDANMASKSPNPALNVKKDLAKTKKKSKFSSQIGQVLGRHQFMRSNVAVPKVSAEKNRQQELKTLVTQKQAPSLKRRPVLAGAPEMTSEKQAGSKTDARFSRERVRDPKSSSPVATGKNATVDLKTNQSFDSRSEEKLNRSPLCSAFHRVTHARERSRSDENMKANRLTRDNLISAELHEGMGPRPRSGHSPQGRQPSGHDLDPSECSGDHAGLFNVGNGEVTTKETPMIQNERDKFTQTRTQTEIFEDRNSPIQTLVLTANETAQTSNTDNLPYSGLTRPSSFTHEKERSQEKQVIVGLSNPRNSNPAMTNIKKIFNTPAKTSSFTRDLTMQSKAQNFLKSKHVLKDTTVHGKNSARKQRESPEKSTKAMFKPQVSQTLKSKEKKFYFVKRPSPQESAGQSKITHYKPTAVKHKSHASPSKRTDNTLVKTVQHWNEIRKTPMEFAKQEPKKAKKEDKSSTEGRSRFEQYLKNKRQWQECCSAVQTAALNQPDAATSDIDDAQPVIEYIGSPRLVLKADNFSEHFSEYTVGASSLNVGSGKLPRGKKLLQDSPRPGPESCLTGIHSQRRASSLEDITELSPENVESPPSQVKPLARYDSAYSSPARNEVLEGTSRGIKSSPPGSAMSREASWSQKGNMDDGDGEAKKLTRLASNCSRKSSSNDSARGILRSKFT